MHVFVFVCLFRSILADLVVNTNSGPVRGVSSLADDVEAFLSIPYAEPPIRDLRFAKPLPKKQWTIVRNESSLPPPCPQLSINPYYFSPDVTNMSEDCLYLNIWAPKPISPRSLKPVIIYIHPGSFISGSSNLRAHDGSNFASRGDVIVVTINHRLGALGYLLTNSGEAPGNMGMHDQILAMKWVKRNAKLFGGNPRNIVLMGVSAGAYSVSAHMISPLSKNLFKKAILQSGSIMQPVTLESNAILYENSQTVASFVGCSNETTTLQNDPHSVIDCLKKAPIANILDAERSILFSNRRTFYPSVNDEFLPKSSNALIREGKFRKDIDVLIGMNKEEGTLFLVLVRQDYFGRYGENVANLSKASAFNISRDILLNMREPNSTEITRYYMNQVRNGTRTGYLKVPANILGDYAVSCSTKFFADFLSLKGNSVFFYEFGFRSSSTPMAEWVGATHLDEVQYVFGSPYHANFTAEEIELSHRLIDRWSAFARTGNPSIPGHLPWPQYSYHEPLYLAFGQEEESIRFKPLNRCDLWRKQFNADVDAETIRVLQNCGMNTKNSVLSQKKYHYSFQ